ncbi:hypothetical protein [Staphylococcus argensis]|uniref:hypothetical protein n=1 Tax=Staphylococcus argensis TaxID=1607738 RepID=UPI0011A719B6|nr:hypothetical protein [Staphylococcus argensis]
MIKDQSYEQYWKLTLGTSAFFDVQFIRTLKIIIDHIEKYRLMDKKVDELVKNPDAKRKNVKEEIVHYKELVDKIKYVYPNDDNTGATTRKQINQYIKLGFIKPYLNGYCKNALEYIKPNKDKEELSRLFSDIVYQYSSFNSSVTNDDTECNQIKFIVKTLLNKKEKVLTIDQLIGIMQIDINNKEYAKEKDILTNTNWATSIEFVKRKYNQAAYLRSVLRNLSLFKAIGSNADYKISLVEDAKEYLPESGDTKRDSYRFGLMRKAVLKESEQIYGKRVCWLSKQESRGLVVSHIYASHKALSNWDIDEAYDPKNALLLKPGDIDDYFDKYKYTIDQRGNMVFSNELRNDFVNTCKENNYSIDNAILDDKRKGYLKIHNKEFDIKFNV